MDDNYSIQLKDGRHLEVTVLTYPIPGEDQITLIQLWRSEWQRTDYDWLEAMNGDYSDTFRIRSIIGRIDGQAVATATVCYPCVDAEVCVIEGVVTLGSCRGLGIASRLTNMAVELSLAAGCQVCYLGNSYQEGSVYLRCGFERLTGVVMRRAAPGGDDYESRCFGLGQGTSIRGAQWGDLPGVSCLLAQPLDCLVLDYPRGILSCKYAEPQSCVGNFPRIRYNVNERGGSMYMLVGEKAHRVLGFGSLTPEAGPAHRHKAVIDIGVHDNYQDKGQELLEVLLSKAEQEKIQAVRSYVATPEAKKAEWFERAGFDRVAELPDELRLGEKDIDVIVFEKIIVDQKVKPNLS